VICKAHKISGLEESTSHHLDERHAASAGKSRAVKNVTAKIADDTDAPLLRAKYQSRQFAITATSPASIAEWYTEEGPDRARTYALRTRSAFSSLGMKTGQAMAEADPLRG
jgi:hypothetical protein